MVRTFSLCDLRKFLHVLYTITSYCYIMELIPQLKDKGDYLY